jgi:hypothetical protein
MLKFISHFPFLTSPLKMINHKRIAPHVVRVEKSSILLSNHLPLFDVHILRNDLCAQRLLVQQGEVDTASLQDTL